MQQKMKAAWCGRILPGFTVEHLATISSTLSGKRQERGLSSRTLEAQAYSLTRRHLSKYFIYTIILYY
jgi:hypothetical protein